MVMPRRRRLPTDIPTNIPVARAARIRSKIDAVTYVLDFGDGIGGPEVGYYSGAGELVAGQVVTAHKAPELANGWRIQGVGQAVATEFAVVAVGTDDGYWNPDDNTDFDTVDSLHIHNGSVNAPGLGTATRHSGWVRFDNVNLNQGQTVPQINVRLYGFETTIPGPGDREVTIAAYDADDPAAPTTWNEVEAMWTGRTTATVAWNDDALTIVNDQLYFSPDVSPILQELVDRAGWANGNAVVLLFQVSTLENPGDGAGHAYDSFDSESDHAPALVTDGTVPTPAEAVSHDDLEDVSADDHHAQDHAARHVDGGADELDGDTLDVDFTPSNYTPDATPTEANDVDDLAAHLKGIDDALGSGNATVRKTFTFGLMGTVSVGILAPKAPSPEARTVTGVYLSARTGPTGAALLVDVYKNGVTMFTTQANRPSIADGSTQSAAEAVPDITSIAKNDLIEVDIDQVGSSVAGADLVVEIRCTAP